MAKLRIVKMTGRSVGAFVSWIERSTDQNQGLTGKASSLHSGDNIA
jgi:hypothetical protein